jgi:hypothetical protein
LREHSEHSGQWAMAAFIVATDTSDVCSRKRNCASLFTAHVIVSSQFIRYTFALNDTGVT